MAEHADALPTSTDSDGTISNQLLCPTCGRRLPKPKWEPPPVERDERGWVKYQCVDCGKSFTWPRRRKVPRCAVCSNAATKRIQRETKQRQRAR